MIGNNYSILPWYNNLSKQYHNKWYTNGRGYSLLTGINQIPPFQLVRQKTGSSIDYFKLVDCSRGTKTTLTSEITAAGLTVYEGSQYDVIIYPSTVTIPVSQYLEGTFYAEMSDGTNIWYSELFVMTTRVSEMIKIQFCHATDLERPSGIIRYEDGFKNHLYVNSELAKPTYPYEEQVQKRGGYTYPIEQISWKQHQFELIAPEYLLDMIRLIRIHDYVTIFKDGETYEVDEMIIPNPDWIPNGNLGRVNIAFKTDTVVTVSGRGVSDTNCEPIPGSCLVVDFTAVSRITEGSAEYIGFYYLDSEGQQVSLVDSDYVIIEESGGDVVLYQYAANAYSAASVIQNQVVFDARNYHYYSVGEIGGLVSPAILDATVLNSETTLSWQSIFGSIAEFWAVHGDGQERLLGAAVTEASTGSFTFTRIKEDTHVKLKAGSALCGVFDESPLFKLPTGDFSQDFSNDFNA